MIRRGEYFWLPVLLMVFALGVNVATRTSTVTVFHGISVSEKAGNTMRQHMDSDGAQWVPPVAIVISAAAVVSSYPRFAPASPPRPDLLFEESLYNRPPPSC